MSNWSRLADEAAERAAEYAHLRDNGATPEEAAGQVGLRSRTSTLDYEAAYQAQREGRAA